MDDDAYKRKSQELAIESNRRRKKEWQETVIDQYWWFLNSYFFENMEERPPEILASIVRALVNEGKTQSGYLNGKPVVNYYGKWYDPVLGDYADIVPGDKYEPYDFIVPKEFLTQASNRTLQYLGFAFSKFAKPSPRFRDIPPQFFLDFWHFYGGPSNVIAADRYDIKSLAEFFLAINHEVEVYRDTLVFPSIGMMYRPSQSLDLVTIDRSVLEESHYKLNTGSRAEEDTDLRYFLWYLDLLYPMY